MLSIRSHHHVTVKLIVIMYHKTLLGVCMIVMKFEFSFAKYMYYHVLELSTSCRYVTDWSERNLDQGATMPPIEKKCIFIGHKKCTNS